MKRKSEVREPFGHFFDVCKSPTEKYRNGSNSSLFIKGRIGRGFAEKEWQSVFHSLVPFLSHARWLNPLGPLQISKPDQLKLAQEVGLTVPKTTITNHAAAIEKLFDDGRVIFKALSPPFTSANDMVFTREITREFPSYFQASIAQCPAIYQELVERKSDLRITVVGREVFVVRIASQTLEEEKDRLDWRRKQDKYDIFSQAEVSLCVEIVNGISLQFCHNPTQVQEPR